MYLRNSSNWYRKNQSTSAPSAVLVRFQQTAVVYCTSDHKTVARLELNRTPQVQKLWFPSGRRTSEKTTPWPRVPLPGCDKANVSHISLGSRPTEECHWVHLLCIEPGTSRHKSAQVTGCHRMSQDVTGLTARLSQVSPFWVPRSAKCATSFEWLDPPPGSTRVVRPPSATGWQGEARCAASVSRHFAAVGCLRVLTSLHQFMHLAKNNYCCRMCWRSAELSQRLSLSLSACMSVVARIHAPHRPFCQVQCYSLPFVLLDPAKLAYDKL